METNHGIAYELLYGGGPFAMLRVRLPQGMSMKAESDAMVSMDMTIDVEGKMEGGLLSSVWRKFVTGDSFFFQTLTARRGPGEVLFSPGILGDLCALELDGYTEYQMSKGAFFAATNGIILESKFQGLGKGLFSGEGFFVQKVTGKGLLFVESFGAIHVIDIPAGEERIIDNHHLVAWPSNVPYRLEKASKSWISTFTSGEMVVCRFTGPGKVLIQTRNPPAFAEWIGSQMPKRS